ncbi:MAG: hypothetical protein AAFQ37_02055 [Bacteroidota bacterium]
MAPTEKDPLTAINASGTDTNEPAPILGSWRNLYTFVLALHALIIILFYLFSRAYA